jgi:hypothetical protein
MAVTKLNADTVVCTLVSAGTNTGTITFDIAADSNPLMSMGAHTVNKYKSQNLDDSTLLANGKYEAVTLTVSFVKADFDLIEKWWISGEKLTYSVSGGGEDGSDALSETYSDCIVRISDTPSVTPGQKGYVTCTVEIQSLAGRKKGGE